jgi:hypothetical protein
MTLVHDPHAPPAPGPPQPDAPLAAPWLTPARPGLLARLVAAAGRAGRGGRPVQGGASEANANLRERLDLRNTWQVVAGSILVPLGVVLILMAWYGSAHTPYVQQQIPYLVSGSFAGLGCIVLGGLLYWAHWLYRLYDQADLHHEEHLQALQQTIAAMAERIGRGPDNGATASGDEGRAGDPLPSGVHPGADGDVGTVTVVRTAGGRYYHDPSCPVVSHHGATARPLATGDDEGLAPCQICRPPTPGDLVR